MSMWFHGPTFLYENENSWNEEYKKGETSEERKKVKVFLANTSHNILSEINHRNSFRVFQRIVAYVLRIKHQIPRVKNINNQQHTPMTRNLSVLELNEALIFIIQQVQNECFTQDIKDIKKHGVVNKNSTICSLAPELDKNQILRVGGRIQASDQSYDSKHQMLLPYNHKITKLIMQDCHNNNHHAAPQALLAIVRQRFWPINGKIMARSIVHNCVKCCKLKPKLFSQIMGNLPARRVQAARPFMNSGVDFFGPISTHFKGRGRHPQKSYVAVFCCFATKAVHFEVVTDLTTEAFIGALRRFTGRRGNCRNLHCDNATNFIGARNRLTELQNIIHSAESKEAIQKYCGNKGIDFHFIPPRSPHFGGLWEAAVKSAKKLLMPTLAVASLTYEELETLMIEIEAILNSRPITPLSADPNDISALTPGHFLIGEPPTNIVDPQVQSVKDGLLNRWKQVTQLKNQFWQRWSKEYLCELQQRQKWRHQHSTIKPGMMVLLKEDNLPVMSWRMGRIIQTIKGNDNIIRVADVQTSGGVLRRAIHNLAPLPAETTNEISDGENAEFITSESSKDIQEPIIKEVQDTAQDVSTLISTNDHPAANSAPQVYQIITLLNLFLVFLLAIPAKSQMHVHPFQSPPGIYFENLGNTHLVSNEWNLVVYFNTSFLWQEINSLKQNLNNLTDICEYNAEKKPCRNTILQFSSIINDIEETNQIIFQRKRPMLRTKRGAINIIGNIANSLFGVLDSNYAETMARNIQNLRNDDNKLLQLIKNQTTIIDSTVNLVQSAVKDNNVKMKQLQDNMNEMLEVIKTESTFNRVIKSAQWFNSLAVQMMIVLQHYQRIQSTVIDVLADTHNGKIHPQLITPNQLEQQVEIIRKNIPANVRLPAEIDDLLKLYHLMSVEGRVTSDHQQVIFRIRVPLYNQEQFELLRVVPVPFQINSTVLIIHSLAEYLMINLHRDQYYPLSKTELKECVMNNEEFVCKQHQPLYDKESRSCTCEVNVINHWSWYKTCQLKITSNPPRWIQLLQPNQWIYCLFNKTTLNVVYNDTSVTQELKGSGIVELPAGCSVKDEGMTITGHNIYTSKLKQGIIPSKLLSDVIDLKTPEELQHQYNIESNLTEHIKTIKDDLRKLKDNEHLPIEVTNQHVHHYILGYITLLLILVVIVGLLVAYSQGKIKIPVPQPRNRRRPSFNFPANLELPAEPAIN